VAQENPTALEPKNQILATAIQRRHAFTFELGGHLEAIAGGDQPGIPDLDALEPSARDGGLEPAANRLDLR
jgi:hypothetical protein